MAKLGGVCSILAGTIYAISGGIFFVYQVGHVNWDSVASISEYFKTAPGAGLLWGIVNYGAAIASFLAIAGVQALSDRMRSSNDEIVRWVSTLAIIGYSIIAITNVADYTLTKRLATGYAELNSSGQSSLEILGVYSLDSRLILRFISIGPWFLVAGYLSRRKRLLPQPLAWLGIFAGAFALLVVSASILEFQSITMFSVVAALSFHPIWLIWTGIMLKRENTSSVAIKHNHVPQAQGDTHVKEQSSMYS